MESSEPKHRWAGLVQSKGLDGLEIVFVCAVCDVRMVWDRHSVSDVQRFAQDLMDIDRRPCKMSHSQALQIIAEQRARIKTLEAKVNELQAIFD